MTHQAEEDIECLEALRLVVDGTRGRLARDGGWPLRRPELQVEAASMFDHARSMQRQGLAGVLTGLQALRQLESRMREGGELHELLIADDIETALRAFESGPARGGTPAVEVMFDALEERWEHYSAIRLSWHGARAWLMDEVGGPGARGPGSSS